MDKPSELDRRQRLSSPARTAPSSAGRRQELGPFEHTLRETLAGRPRNVEHIPRAALELTNQPLHHEVSTSPAVVFYTTPALTNQETPQLFPALSHTVVTSAQGHPTLLIAHGLRWTDWSSLDLDTVRYTTLVATQFHGFWVNPAPGRAKEQR